MKQILLTYLLINLKAVDLAIAKNEKDCLKRYLFKEVLYGRENFFS